MVAAPILFYPLSKTLWMAMNLMFHPVEREELEWMAERTRTHNREHALVGARAMHKS